VLSFIYRIMRAAMLDAAVYEEVEADPRATWQAATVVVLSSLAAGLGATGIQGPSLSLQMTISGLALLTWAAWAMLVLQIGARWIPERRTRADIGQLLRTVGFAAAPGLIQVFAMQPPLAVPVFVGAWLWMFAAMVIAIRQALDYRSTGHALLVTAMGFALVAGLVVLLSLLGPAAG
jgi:hypothetical protein